ncbi:roadblock/LC7 domain-containing protein [Streptomyces microflavus]
MVPEAETRGVLDELQRLRARVPLLAGALAASTDGLVLAHDTPGIEAEGVAALTAAALGVSIRMTEATGRGGFRELLVRGESGYIATYAAGSSAVLTLLAEDRINVGRLHLEGRRAGARIGELVDTALERAERTPPCPAPPQRAALPTARSRSAPRSGPAPPPAPPRPPGLTPSRGNPRHSYRNGPGHHGRPRKGNEPPWRTPKRH